MTPERRKAVWAIYGKSWSYLFQSVLETNLLILVCERHTGFSCVFVPFNFAVWCRRTDELVDGPNASYITPTALDRWEKRLEDLFEGCPYDMYDAALADTVSKFPVDIQVNQPTDEFGATCLEVLIVNLAITAIY